MLKVFGDFSLKAVIVESEDFALPCVHQLGINLLDFTIPFFFRYLFQGIFLIYEVEQKVNAVRYIKTFLLEEIPEVVGMQSVLDKFPFQSQFRLLDILVAGGEILL